ncbi:unnamed protein product [Brassica oleracea var. botrytis]
MFHKSILEVATRMPHSSAGNFFLFAVEFSVILKAKTFGNFSVKYPTKMDLLELPKRVWVYFAMPELGVNSGRPLPNRPSPPLLAYSGGKGRKCLQEAIRRYSHVVHYIEKDFDEMFPKCDDEAEDTTADNIIKIMFNAPKYWKWTMDCWEAAGTKAWTNPLKTVLRPQKKGSKEPPADDRKEALTDERKEAPAEDRSKSSIGVDGMSKAQIEQGFKDLVDSMRDGFQMCLQEIKLIGDRLEAVEKNVGISKKRLHLMIFNSLLQLSINVGTKSGLVMKPLPKSQDVVSLGKVLGNKTETWMLSICMSEHSESVNGAKPGQKDAQEQSGSTTSSSSKELSLVIANVNDPKMTEAKVTEPTVDPSVVLLDKGIPTKPNIQQQEDRRHTKKDIALVFFRGSSIAKVIIPNTKIVHGYDPFAPVDKKRTDVLIDWLKLDICYKTTVAKKPPACPSLWYYILQSLLAWLTDSVSYKHFANLKRFGGGEEDVDVLYAPVNYNNDHWIAIWISIPNKHIVVWDSILKHIKPAVLDEARCGDCDVFALKYIECHMLEMSFPAAFSDKNGKAIGKKLAVDIFEETLSLEGKDNEDYDAIRASSLTTIYLFQILKTYIIFFFILLFDFPILNVIFTIINLFSNIREISSILPRYRFHLEASYHLLPLHLKLH